MNSAAAPGVKVLALLTDGYGTGGGISQYNRDLLSALSSSVRVSQVLALPRRGTAHATELPPNVVQLPPAASKLGWGVDAVRVAWRWRPDVIFCGHINAAPLAALLARTMARPLWVQAHGFEAWTERGAAIGNALAGASLVTAVSRHTRARLLGWCDLSPEIVRVLPNTVSARYAPRPRRADLAARYGLTGRKVILSVGRLAAAERYKGHARIIDALPAIARQALDVSYLVVGAGDDLPALAAQAVARGVRDRVIFAGAVPADELADHYALADVFAMPSTGEGFGIVFLEAAMMGLPLVGGAVDGSADALADGQIGRLVDPLHEPQLVAALLEALAGRQQRDAAAVHRFAFVNFARHVDLLLGDLLDARTPAAVP